MLDVAVAYNRYKFIGNEFLTWLWFQIDTDQAFLRSLDEEMLSLHIGNRIMLENRHNELSENITIKGDDAGLEEGLLALRKGAVVVEMNLAYTVGEQEWHFTLKGENLSFYSLKTPETGAAESQDDMEGMVLEKVYLVEKGIDLLTSLFNAFVKERSSQGWHQKTVPKMRNWIQA